VVERCGEAVFDAAFCWNEMVKNDPLPTPIEQSVLCVT